MDSLCDSMRETRIANRLGFDSNASINVIIVANALVWYLSAFKFLQDVSKAPIFSELLIPVIAINIAALIFSAFIGTLILDRFKRRLAFLKYWTIVGIFLSSSLALLDLTNPSVLIAIAGVLGAYFGIGIPAFMGYFAATTTVQNRARLGGITILIMGISFPIISSIGGTDIIVTAIALSIWRLIGLVPIFILKPLERPIAEKEKVSFKAVVSNRSFLLYVIPWLMFSLVNDLTMIITDKHFENEAIFGSDFVFYKLIIQAVLVGASAIIFGFVADKKGRKRLALIGIALSGLGYAAIGLFTNNPFAAWFYVVADAIAWGTFTMLFVVILWGDLAQEKSSEKYYFIGLLPYVLSSFISHTIGQNIADGITNGNGNAGTVFSFASFFLFIAILPLIYAPETLSDKIMKSLDLSNYVDKALKIAKKESVQNHKENHEDESDKAEDSIHTKEYEDAQKLAEKYY
jgi:MFS family permease